MQCPDDVFRKLKLALNDGWSEDPEVISFAYLANSSLLLRFANELFLILELTRFSPHCFLRARPLPFQGMDF